MRPYEDRTNLVLHPPILWPEQFLHGALFDVAFLGDELLQGFDEGIRIAQRLGDRFLLVFGRREDDWKLELRSNPDVSTGPST